MLTIAMEVMDQHHCLGQFLRVVSALKLAELEQREVADQEAQTVLLNHINYLTPDSP